MKVLKILSHASAVIAEGEVDQLTAQRQIDTGEDQYLAIIAAKTAALFAAACRVAPVVAEAGEEAEAALDSFGRNLGIAFQLIDDVIDYASDAATMGKGVGDDFRDGKMTLPVILAYARGNDADRAFWDAAIAGESHRDDDLAHAIALLGSSGALADTLERARIMAAARSMRLPPSPPAGPRRRWSKPPNSRSRALIEPVGLSRRRHMKLGMIGLGRMGGNMARRLVDGGHEVVAYDRDPEAVADAVSHGAIAAPHSTISAQSSTAPQSTGSCFPPGTSPKR